jgi:hypothetical protein
MSAIVTTIMRMVAATFVAILVLYAMAHVVADICVLRW